MELARFGREEFKHTRWAPQAGESVFFCQPSQGGKTHWAFDLLGVTEHAKPPVALVMKPIDPTPAAWTRRLGYREVATWPPPFTLGAKPPGYTLWPKHQISLDPASIETSNKNLKTQFERALMDAYKNGHRTVFVDEIYGLLAELDMGQTVNALLTRGMGMGSGLWYATQKPSGTVGSPMPGFVFNSWVHGFFGHDPVEANRKRFAEISGINSGLVAETVHALEVRPTATPQGLKPVSELLYINRNGPRGGYMAIIDTV